jgi:pimeloyl-ACP methyl ester carboxylesterase
MMRTIVGLVVLAAIASATVVGWKLFDMAAHLTIQPDYVHPRPPGFTYATTPKSEAGLDFEDYTLKLPNGAALRGWRVPAEPSSRRVVITVHGRSGTRASTLAFLPMLHRLGADVVLIDLQENGLSDGAGRGTGLGEREAEDVAAVARDLRTRGYTQIIAMGCSLGGTAVVLAGAREPVIDAVIAECPLDNMARYVADNLPGSLVDRGPFGAFIAGAVGRAVVTIARWQRGLGPITAAIDAAPRLAGRPVLIVHGLSDGGVLPDHGRRLAAAVGPSAQLWLVDRAGHCAAMAVAPSVYAERVGALFARLPPTPAR